MDDSRSQWFIYKKKEQRFWKPKKSSSWAHQRLSDQKRVTLAMCGIRIDYFVHYPTNWASFYVNSDNKRTDLFLVGRCYTDTSFCHFPWTSFASKTETTDSNNNWIRHWSSEDTHLYWNSAVLDVLWLRPRLNASDQYENEWVSQRLCICAHFHPNYHIIRNLCFNKPYSFLSFRIQ